MYGHDKSAATGGDSAAEQTDPLDFSCGSTGSELGGYDAATAAAKVVHSYTFGRPLHCEYPTERSLYYRDSLGGSSSASIVSSSSILFIDFIDYGIIAGLIISHNPASIDSIPRFFNK